MAGDLVAVVRRVEEYGIDTAASAASSSSKSSKSAKAAPNSTSTGAGGGGGGSGGSGGSGLVSNDQVFAIVQHLLELHSIR